MDLSHCQDTPAHEKLGHVSGIFEKMLKMGEERVIRSYRALNDTTNAITLSVRQEPHRSLWVDGWGAAFLPLIPMHLFVSKEEGFQHLGERKQADTMQSEKSNGCVAAKGEGPQRHGTF